MPKKGRQIAMDTKRQEIEKFKQKIADLERQVEDERRQKLVNLHQDLGYANRRELISALQSLSGGKPGKGRRTVITPELRGQILAAVKSGKAGTAVAREFGVSVPTVQNIKKQGGLVRKGKARGKKK